MHLGANSTPYKSSFSPLWGFCVSLFCLYNIGYDTSFSGTETASAWGIIASLYWRGWLRDVGRMIKARLIDDDWRISRSRRNKIIKLRCVMIFLYGFQIVSSMYLCLNKMYSLIIFVLLWMYGPTPSYCCWRYFSGKRRMAYNSVVCQITREGSRGPWGDMLNHACLWTWKETINRIGPGEVESLHKLKNPK